ncbi:MAG: ImmA/IrrE family metallo-endopeptidase [bacterium]|nr:ImmA/IrrE family metallo-endopeptidase [bacterium]
MPTRAAISKIAERMLAPVPPGALNDLRDEDPATAVEVHYPPVHVLPLPPENITSADCSVHGYYERFLDPARPRILYSNAVTPERARFTILHELGHHILVTSGDGLLSDLDQLAGPQGDPVEVEEAACDQFAGEVLVPAELMEQIIGDDPVKPRHVLETRQRTNASWEAVAVQVANYPERRTAVVLIREPGQVSFVARNGLQAWPRGSRVQSGGPLDRALRRDSRRRPDVYRHRLAGAENLYCDTARVDGRLAVAVMAPQRSDGGLTALEPVEPTWKTRDESCEWCGDERDVGWCDHCRGRRCRSCSRCGCQQPIESPVCPECHLENPIRSGSRVCRDCEADGLT